jgi:hypothetical protein
VLADRVEQLPRYCSAEARAMGLLGDEEAATEATLQELDVPFGQLVSQGAIQVLRRAAPTDSMLRDGDERASTLRIRHAVDAGGGTR